MKIEKQLQTIQSILKKEDKTVAELAVTLGLSEDTVRTRLNFLKAKRKVRIADWIVLDKTMVRIWGAGSMPDEPRPVRVRVSKPHSRMAVGVKKCKKLSAQKQIINRLMRLTGARNFAQLERKIGSASGVTNRIFHGQSRISHSFFLKVLFYTGMTAERLCDETGIPKDHFFERAE